MDGPVMTTELPGADNATSVPDAGPGFPSTARIIICTLLFIVTLVTIVGNIIVLAAFVIEKKLRTNFTIYIANLAVTDVSVAVFAMWFYTCDVLLGYWPFGEFLCGVWIFFDYGMTFASVFTLVAISVDRFWSVTWSLHYRSHNNRKKVAFSLVIVWVAVLIVWLPSCIYDRIKWSEPRVCKWEPSNNREFVVFVAIVGHHTPCLIMLFCYVKIFLAMQKRSRSIKPGGAGRQKVTPSADQSVSVAVVSRQQETSTTDAERGQMSTGSDSATKPSAGGATGKREAGGEGESKMDKEKKIFVTLSYIIFSYLACWVPFHIVFDLSAADPKLVPDVVYTITFWLTYFNSTLNPFLYAYSSKEFRSVFIRVMKCACFRKKVY